MNSLKPVRLENFKVRGVAKFKQYRDGELIDEWTIKNTVTDVGKAQLAGLLNGVVDSTFKWIALGSSSTAATSGDTSLASEITSAGLGRAAATTSRVTNSVSDDTARLKHTFTATASVTVQEIGAFDTSTQSGGNMMGRTTFSAKNLETDDTVEATYDFQIS